MKVENNQKGFSLIEVLVAVIIIAIGLLGIASLQASAVSATTTSGMRGDAAITVSNLTAYMRANKQYWSNESTGSSTITVSVAGDGTTVNLEGALTSVPKVCSTVQCAPDELAAYDLSTWATYTNTKFINPVTTISLVSAGSNYLEVSLQYTEKDNNEQKTYAVMVSL